MKGVEIRNVTPENISEVGVFCVEIEKRRDGIQRKMDWFREWYREGLRIKMLFVDGKKAGFIEYVPGENAWRAVDARGYVFIHCIWVRVQGRGYGKMLLQECLDDAVGTNGVAVVTSEATWLPSKAFFLANGFQSVQEVPPHFELLVRQFKDSSLPRFKDAWEERAASYGPGLSVLYSDQCPYIDRGIKQIVALQEKHGFPVNFVRIDNCLQAQSSPGVTGVFTLLYDGEVITHKPRLPTKLLRRIIRDIER